MSEKSKALFHGATGADGVPAEWLGPEPGMPAVLARDGTVVVEAVGDEPAVPARHLSQEDYDALSPRNKERVREARSASGAPLYEVRTDKDMSVPAHKAAAQPKTHDGEGE